MKYYPNSVRKVILAMCDAFSGVTYPDYQNNRDLVVPIHYSSVERFLAFWNQYTKERQKYNIHLPVLSLTATSIDPSYDDIQNDQIKMMSCDFAEYVRNPMVVSMTFDLALWCRQDNEAIAWNITEQILAKFNNTKYYPFTALKFTDESTINYNLPIDLNSVSKNFTKFDVDKNTIMGIKKTITFGVKNVRIFPTFQLDPKIINTISIDFENELNAKWALINIFEETGGTIVTSITDPV